MFFWFRFSFALSLYLHYNFVELRDSLTNWRAWASWPELFSCKNMLHSDYIFEANIYPLWSCFLMVKRKMKRVIRLSGLPWCFCPCCRAGVAVSIPFPASRFSASVAFDWDFLSIFLSCFSRSPIMRGIQKYVLEHANVEFELQVWQNFNCTLPHRSHHSQIFSRAWHLRPVWHHACWKAGLCLVRASFTPDHPLHSYNPSWTWRWKVGLRDSNINRWNSPSWPCK